MMATEKGNMYTIKYRQILSTLYNKWQNLSFKHVQYKTYLQMLNVTAKSFFYIT